MFTAPSEPPAAARSSGISTQLNGYKQTSNWCLEQCGLHCDFMKGTSGSAATRIKWHFIRHGVSRCHPGTHPKRLVRYKWKVRNRRLLFPPFSGYTRVSDKLSLCKHSFQFYGYICRRIFGLSTSKTDAKAATQTEQLSISQKKASKPQMPPILFLSLLKPYSGTGWKTVQLVQSSLKAQQGQEHG